jgi:hypothetical protein
MTVSKTFRFNNDEDRKYVLDIVNKIADQFSDEINIQGDTIVKLCKIFEEGVSSIEFDDLPQSVQDTIRLADCDFIRHSSLEGFECYEAYHKEKKSKPIGRQSKKVIALCVLCKIGKAKVIQNQIEAQFRKKGVTSFVKLINDLIRIDHEGAVAQIFLCQARRFVDDELHLSPDCTHFKCPELDGELIEIENHCLIQTNPFTLEKPCRYLVAPFLKVNIKVPKETQVILDEVKRLETLEETQEPIEVEATVIEPDEGENGEDNNE